MRGTEKAAATRIIQRESDGSGTLQKRSIAHSEVKPEECNTR